MDADEAEVCEVSAIVNSGIVQGVVQYRARWADCTEVEDTWGTIDDGHNCQDKLKQFQQKFLRNLHDERVA